MKKDDLELVPVSIFPGGVTSAFRTSSRCACCGNDPLALAYAELEANADSTYNTDADGYLDIQGFNVQICLPQKADKEVFDYHKKRNERVPYTPVINTKIKASQLPQKVRDSLRRPFKALGAKGSKAGVIN